MRVKKTYLYKNDKGDIVVNSIYHPTEDLYEISQLHTISKLEFKVSQVAGSGAGAYLISALIPENHPWFNLEILDFVMMLYCFNTNNRVNGFDLQKIGLDEKFMGRSFNG